MACWQRSQLAKYLEFSNLRERMFVYGQREGEKGWMKSFHMY